MNSPREYFFQMPHEYGFLAGTSDTNYKQMCKDTCHVVKLKLQLEVGSFEYESIATGNTSKKTMIRVLEIDTRIISDLYSCDTVSEYNLVLPHHGRAIEPAMFVLKWSLELLPTEVKEKIAMHYAWGQSVSVNGYSLEPDSFKEILMDFKLIEEYREGVRCHQDDDEFTQWGASGAYKY